MLSAPILGADMLHIIDFIFLFLQLMMNKVDQFLYDLVYYDKENIHPDVIKVTT